MNIIFIGGVKFSLDLLKSILENNWSVSSVFSYDDSKKKIYSDFASLDETTSRFNVKHFKVININDENNVEIIKKIKPDLILVMGWSQLLSNDILKIPKKKLYPVKISGKSVPCQSSQTLKNIE